MDLETGAGTVMVSRGERFAEGQTLAIGIWLLTSVMWEASSLLVRFCSHVWTCRARDFHRLHGKGQSPWNVGLEDP